jgi:hypothetical protein
VLYDLRKGLDEEELQLGAWVTTNP